MAFEHKPGQGSLFRNDRKEKDTHADYQGTLVLPDGTECWLNAWLKDGGKGKFFSLSVKPKQQSYGGNKELPETKGGHGGSRGGGAGGDLDDEIPF